MPETYNLYNLEAPFEEYLVAGNQKAVSIKNYLSDVRHFFGWLILYFKSNKIQIESEATITQFITSKAISEYRSYLSENNIPHKTINRRLSTIRKFCSFCISQGWMKENPAKQVLNIGGLKDVVNIKATESPKKSLLSKIRDRISKITTKPKVKESPATPPPAKLPLQYYMGFVIILIFVAVMGAGIYNQFFVTNNQSLAYPTALTKAGRILSFQGRLTDTLGNPITTATNVQFRLWKLARDLPTDPYGTEGTCTNQSGEDCLYKTGSCSVTPDQDGIFSSLIGSTCGSEIDQFVFSENPNVYLGITVGGDTEMTPRQQIANVGYAINSETLQGLPPGTGTSVIPYINNDGNLLISASTPGIRSTSTSTDFTLSSAKATVIQSAGTGDIVLQATESGSLIFRTGGDTGANTRITVTNSGNVGIGTINPAATALLDLTSTTQGFLAPRMTTTERDAIVSPATGLMIYNTTTNQYNVFNGTTWGAVAGDSAWVDAGAYLYPTTGEVLGNPTSAGSDKIAGLYLSDSSPLVFGTDNDVTYSFSGSELAVTPGNNDINFDSNTLFIDGSANKVGVGDTTPASAFTVGNGDLFQVDSSGDMVKIKNLTYSWPSAHTTNGALVNNGSGGLSWATIGASNITPNSLDFTEFQDTMDLDANLILNQGTNTWVQNFTGTTTTGLTYNANSLTSGNAFALSSTSTALTSGKLLNVDWSPGSATTATGDLFSLNIGTNGDITNLLNVKDAGSSVFSVSETAVTSNLPTSFTSPGDVSISYDLLFTNPTASYIKSSAPLTIEAGDSFESNDLTLKTYNSGDVVFDSPGGVTLVQPQAWDLADSSVASLNIESGLLDIDTTNRAVGIGTATPNTTAVLDLTSTTKGFLAPRMTTTERDAIVSPATGLLIYNTSTNQYNVYNGSVWAGVGGGGGAWSGLTDPITDLSLAMSAYTSTFTYNTATGANNLFNLTDTTGNTGTGYLLNVTTASGSSLKPFHVSAAGNEALTVLANGNVGVGNASPSSLFSVGAGDLFQVDTSGNTSLDNQADIRFYEADANGTNYTGFQAPTSLAGDVIYSLPNADGTSGFLLQTDGSGSLSWYDIANSTNAGPWTVDNGAIYPDNSTLDLFIGGTASSSADFAFVNVDSGTPAASISGNLALAAPAGADPTGTLSIFNGGSLNFQTSVGGDAGLLSRLFITNSGNLGIGTTAPTQKLTLQQDNVADMLGIKDGANNTNLLLADGGVTTFKPTAFDMVQTCSGVSCVSADTGSFTNNTTEAKSNAGTPYIMLPAAAPGSGAFYMGLDHKFGTINIDVVTANIGMSTMLVEYWDGAAWTSVSPTDNTTRLTVDGTITFNAPSDWTANSINGTSKYYVRLRNSVGTISTAPTAYFSTPTTGSRFYVYGQSGDANAALYISDNGNVGLGTNTPQARLDIGGSTSTITNTSGDITIDATSNSISFAGDTLTNFVQALGGSGTVSAPTYSFTSSTNTGLYLATTSVLRFTTAGSDRMTIDALGNVGIGTTAPAYKLDVSGTVGANYFVDNNNANYGLDPAGTGNFGGYSLKTSGGALLAYDTGKVGIGNQTPVGKLDVSGYVTGKALTILNETGNQALLTASASGVTKFTVNHDGSITLAGQTSAPTNLNGGPLVSGTIYYSNTTITGGLSGVTAPTNTGATTGDLFLYGEDSAWHRIALDMTQYSSSAANIENTGYIEIAHNQNTFDISLTGWVKDIVTNLWKRISDFTATIKRALDNEFNPEFTQKQKVTSVALKPNIGNLGTGADGAITINGTTNINTQNTIAGRSCADGGDGVKYSVSSLAVDGLSATLTTSPSTPTCLTVGDEVLLINLEGSWTSTNPNLGNWETLRVQSVVGPTVTFTTAKTQYYGSGASDDSGLGATNGTQRVMLQRVPNYTNVTLGAAGNFAPSAFDGATGGVMFFRATGTVSVAGGGILHAAARGWRGGGDYGAGYGGIGGESYCAANTYPSGSGAMGGHYTTVGYSNNLCGGGGGGGGRGYNSGYLNNAGSAGVGSYGGAGGGGGGGGASHGSYHGFGGGGAGGGGLGSAGAGGGGVNGGGGGAAGGTSGTGGSGCGSCDAHGRGGGGGGGGKLTLNGLASDTGATKLIFGSGGAAGGYGELNQNYGYDGGDGGAGGGIVYIAANTITVSGTNGISAYGGGGAAGNSGYGGGGGGGAGGTIKLVGATLNLGSGAFVAVNANGGGGGSSTYSGGAGGTGRVGFYNSTASVASGSTAPAAGYDSTVNGYNPYKIYTSKEIRTPGVSSFGNISWNEVLQSGTEVEIQTRTGGTANSTDGSWETWKPTTTSVTINNANTHTDWTGTNATVAENSDSTTTRDIPYFEDEDEATTTNTTKVTATAAGGYAEHTLVAANLSTYQYITAWVRSAVAGQTITLGFGEAAATEQTKTFQIKDENTWQKIYWDISNVTGTSRDAVTKFRFTTSVNGNVFYIDNVNAQSYFTTYTGDAITSTRNSYIQYRAILSTTSQWVTPSISNVKITFASDATIYDLVINQNAVDNYDLDNRLVINEVNLDSYKSVNTLATLNGVLQKGSFDPGTGADGAITISGTIINNSQNTIAGRSCADGGDAVNYSVSSFAPDGTYVDLTTSPSTPTCLAVGDEILLINLEGSWTSTNPNLGNWETLKIQNIAGNRITFATAKTKYFGSGTNDDSGIGIENGTQRVMLQRVPNYTSVTINSGSYLVPSTFNSVKGGVLFFRATGTVSVAGGAAIAADSRGWQGGGDYSTGYGGVGGESFCAGNIHSNSGGSLGGHYTTSGYTNALCGGGGGGGGRGYSDGYINAGGSAGVGLYGGAGGGGGAGGASNGSYHGFGGGGGGGGGLGSAGAGGGGVNGGGSGTSGGTSGTGGSGCGSCDAHGRGGGGGGGGQLTLNGLASDTGATKLIFGSGGAAGGYGELNQNYGYDGGDGGAGGGIIYISAKIINVSGTAGIQANGAAGAAGNAGYGGGGGGGAGGTVKLVGETLNLGGGGFAAVQAVGGGGGSSTYYGGAGGSGRIGFYSSTASIATGSTSPAAGYDDSMNTNTYSLFVSDEIHTPNATTFNKIKWLANLNTYGNVELQTRSGATPNSTDNTWEPWTPATASANLQALDDANTHTNWLATNGTSNEGSTALAIPSGVWSKANNATPGTCDSGGACSYGEGRIGLGSNTRGDDGYIGEGVSVIKDGSTYKMWYAGYDGSNWRIYYATSSDGLTWTKYDNTTPANSDTTGTNGRIPLGSTAGRGDVTHTYTPYVIKDGSTYKMWYTGYSGTNWRIFYATSPDGLTWTKSTNVIEAASNTTGTSGRIPLGTSGGDTSHTGGPSVLLDGSTYKMWYSGHDGTNWRRYYATSSDGLTWTKYDNTTPAASNGASTNGRLGLGTSGTGDVSHIQTGAVIKDGAIYKMWYTAYDGTNWRVYYATSPDGLNWAKFDNTIPLSTSNTTSTNGKIFLGSAGKGDQTHILFPAFLNDGGTYKAWYGGHNGTNTNGIYYVTMPNITTPSSPARDINYFEDEDESDTTKFTLLSSDITGGYAELSTASANLANHDYIALWVMAGEAGNTVKVGFGESSSTEHEQTFDIAARDVWQKIYWDISKIPDNERDAVKYLRITNTGSGTNYIYFDNINANRFMTDPDGSIIRSTPNEYIQYRALITTSKPGFFATLHNVQLEWNNGYKIEQTDANKVRLYNYTGEEQELRLDAIVFGADLAEWYTVNDLTVSAGDVVAMTGQLDDYGVPILKKADETNEKHLAGIISTKAGQTLGLEAADRRLLALSGRVPVKIATDSAPIKFGDLLTSSDTPGYAKKAGIGQQTVGKALESWANNMDKKTILALVGNSIAGPDVGAIQDITKVGITKVVNEFGSTTYQLVNDAGETIQSTAAYSKAVISNIQAGIINSVEVVSESITATQKITSPIADIGTLNVSEKIRSPIVETTDLVASGTAKINEIKPVDRDITFNLDVPDQSSSSGQFSVEQAENVTKGHLSKIIIKGLQGKTVTTIDSEGNASFAGQIIADSLTINNDATVSGNFASNTLTVNDASVSGKLIAKEIESDSIDQITNQLTNQVTNINDIQKLLADIKNQPIPDLNDQTNLSDATNNFESLTVTGNSNLYNVSVSNSLLVGTTLLDQNSIISLASELKLSALSTINLFDGAVVIAKDGKITTSGEIIAKGGIRTNEIRPLTENDQVEINNLITNNIAITDKYLEATTSASIIAAADNFDLNGIFAPAIETATASAGIAILPESSSEVIIYNNYVKKDSLIYLTPTSLSSPVSLTVGKKEECLPAEASAQADSPSVCKTYFTVVTNTPSTLPVKFNWLIIN